MKKMRKGENRGGSRIRKNTYLGIPDLLVTRFGMHRVYMSLHKNSAFRPFITLLFSLLSVVTINKHFLIVNNNQSSGPFFASFSSLNMTDNLFSSFFIPNHDVQADLSCRSTRAEIGTIFTQSNFLTLKYSTDRYSKPGDGFKLVITAFKDTREYITTNYFLIFLSSKSFFCTRGSHEGDI